MKSFLLVFSLFLSVSAGAEPTTVFTCFYADPKGPDEQLECKGETHKTLLEAVAAAKKTCSHNKNQRLADCYKNLLDENGQGTGLLISIPRAELQAIRTP